MATIILEETEAFEHCHGGPSQTFLIDGHAEIEMMGEIIRLEKGLTIHVQAGASHTIRNAGPGRASVGCMH